NASSVLADALDEQGDADAAFQAYTDAGTLFVRAYTPQFANRQSAYEQVSELTAEFAAVTTFPMGPSTLGSMNGEAAHVFLLGFPRSGTTLLEAILTANPQIVSTEERDHLGEAASLLEGPGVIAKFGRLSEVEAGRFRRAYWESVASCGTNVKGRVFLDKLPLNTIKLPLIRRLFPNAKIVFALRDPRDVVLSCFRRRLGLNPSMFELLTIDSAARFYGAVMDLFDTYTKKLALDVSYVRYEDVVANFEGEARRLCAVIGVGWTDEMKSFAETTRLSATPSGLQVKKGLYETGAGQWKKYERHMGAVLPALAPWVQRWGYSKIA
ncbi:MAG: sulfotransferase, partial [Alphaproteobacteria bacterium]|nr:sulfotransferase [Alphaproteobacteria bacterium]